MFFLEMYGRAAGFAGGRAGSMHLADPSQGHILSSAIVASGIPLAAGAAFANKRASSGRVSCIFFGDGALEEGVFWETLNVSCAMKLPVFFVCEDNGLAMHTLKNVRQGFRSITEIVRKFECAVFEEDTTDVEKIYRVAAESARTLTTDPKPVFFNFKCYRYLEHVGTAEDYDAGYRTRQEQKPWLERDCVSFQRQRLLEAGTAETDLMREERLIEERIEKCVRQAKAAPLPEKSGLARGVFYEKN